MKLLSQPITLDVMGFALGFLLMGLRWWMIFKANGLWLAVRGLGIALGSLVLVRSARHAVKKKGKGSELTCIQCLGIMS